MQRKGDLGAVAVNLVWCSSAESGVKGQIAGISVGWFGLDIATPLALGARLATAARAAPGKPIQGSVQAPSFKLFTRADLIAALPRPD